MPDVKYDLDARYPVFFLREAGKINRKLRRYAGGDYDSAAKKYIDPCPATGCFHNAELQFDIIPFKPRPDGTYGEEEVGMGRPDNTDPRWPTVCTCGYVFKPTDAHQLFTDIIYVNDAGEEMTLRDAKPGAMWYADWMLGGPASPFRGPDGHCLTVKCPDGHDWLVDQRASNCDMPNDNVHKCWVRHGDPAKNQLHVDKKGVTCHAGAGSIDTGHWHGFLHNNELYRC